MRLAPLAILLPLLLVGVADDARASADALTTGGDGGYGYVFRDDLMTGNGTSGAAPRITVASHVVRTVLIRPRTNFVPEMLKSVENL